MIYLYAIAERAPGLPAPSGRGIADAPLRVVGHGGLAGVHSLDPPARLEPTEAALWSHERVAADLMADRAVLPLRFGSVLDDEGALRALLQEREREFADALAFVRGGVEMSVRARLGEPRRTGAPASGRAYIAERLDRRRRADLLTRTLRSELAPLARAVTFRTGDEEVAGAYLVDRDRMGEFMLRTRELNARRPEADLACTGPWPPYNFTTPGGRADG